MPSPGWSKPLELVGTPRRRSVQCGTLWLAEIDPKDPVHLVEDPLIVLRYFVGFLVGPFFFGIAGLSPS